MGQLLYCSHDKNSLASIKLFFHSSVDIVSIKDELQELAEAAPVHQKGKREGYLAAKKIELISTFPVPNTKADIIDFLSTSVSLANKKVAYLKTRKGFLTVVVIAGLATVGFGLFYGLIFYSGQSFAEENLKKAWRAKCDQVLMKGRSLRGDAEFSQQLDYYENLLNKE